MAFSCAPRSTWQVSLENLDCSFHRLGGGDRQSISRQAPFTSVLVKSQKHQSGTIGTRLQRSYSLITLDIAKSVRLHSAARNLSRARKHNFISAIRRVWQINP